MAAPSEYVAVKNYKGKSDIWQHFGLQKLSENDKIVPNVAVCYTCNGVVKCSGGTTNLTTHVRRHHPVLLSKSKKEQQKAPASADMKVPLTTTVPQLFAMTKKYPPAGQRARDITDKVARFIVKDLRPYSIVDSTDFKNMIHCLDPRYTCPSRKVFADVIIPKMYSENKEVVKRSLKGAEQVALTTDGWTSRASESYMTITSSHITDDWEIQNFVLQTRELPESHTGQHVAEVLQAAVNEWELPTSSHQPVNPPLVTDNASNMTKAAEIFGCLHFGCYAHTLNLAAQKCLAVKPVQHLLGRIRRIVAYFHRSNIANAVLKAKAELLSLPQHKLIIDVCTRWNSAYDMVERFLEMQVAVFATLRSKDIKAPDMKSFTDDELNLAEELIVLLKPLKDITVVLCSENTPTVSVINPFQHQLINKVLLAKESDSAAIREMKLVISTDLGGRYTQIRDVLSVCSVLDPRFKQLWFLSEADRHMVFHNVVSEAARLHDGGKTTHGVQVKVEPAVTDGVPPLPQLPPEMDVPEPDVIPSTDTGPVSKPTKDGKENKTVPTPEPTPNNFKSKSVYGDIFADVVICCVEPPKSSYMVAEAELLQYREAQCIPVDSNPLVWWKKNEFKYPMLARLAKKYLCIPATSVPSERVFSTAGDILSAQRSRLKAKHVDILIFLKKNLV